MYYFNWSRRMLNLSKMLGPFMCLPFKKCFKRSFFSRLRPLRNIRITLEEPLEMFVGEVLPLISKDLSSFRVLKGSR